MSQSRAQIMAAIEKAAPTAKTDVASITQEAAALLMESEHARPTLMADNLHEAFVKRIESGLVIGTSCETIASLTELRPTVEAFLKKYKVDSQRLKVQETPRFGYIDWKGMPIDADVMEDNSAALCWAEFGIAETGSVVIHSGKNMPMLLNFLPLYLMVAVAKSSILPFLDDYGMIANNIAKESKTPRNMCIMTGASGTTDIEGVLVQGAHGPEFLHIIVIDDL